MANRYSEEKEVHKHFFGPTGRCACGWYRLPTKTYLSQCNVWDNFYEMCKHTESGQSFKTCVEAWKRRDFDTVKTLAQLAKERREKHEYLPRPDFVDPRFVKHSYGEEWVLLEGQPAI